MKFALANIVYWGNMSSGYCLSRAEKFLNGITQSKLEGARDLFVSITGDSLKEIKDVGLPQFSNVSFVSKLRMFLDPENYVTLDRKLLKIKGSGIHTLFDGVTEQPTYIPINSQNCGQYSLWSQKCKEVAYSYFRDKGIIAVDVERGIWKLIDRNRLAEAACIVANM